MIIALIIAAAIAVIDQVIKYFVVQNVPLNTSITVIDNLFSITYIKNKGIAFGMFTNMRWFFVVATAVVIIALVVYFIKTKNNNKLALTAAALIIGGGIGNLIDRVFLGYVVDYLSLSFFSPVCNFADYCITAGTILLIIYILFYSNIVNSHSKSKKK